MQRYQSPIRNPLQQTPNTMTPMKYSLIIILILLMITTGVFAYLYLTKTCPTCIPCTETRCLDNFGPNGTLSQNLMKVPVALPVDETTEKVEEGMCMSCSG